ncbi:hypothetical protein [uncultured Roseibium sp.]|uniref:hypothetical protein n=1 Tax=uncultured Roseibium sp. TaxID=1936171 RepID=UPI00259574EC|nr:hypothetical protein [uncultured Roseibium sp.]
MTYALQTTFSRGEVDPEITDRPDLELYRSGLYECVNFVTLKRGGLRRRGGTRFHFPVKTHSAGAWLIPFEFGEGQSYMLEFGEQYFRVHTTGGRVGSVEVATPYGLSVAPLLKFTQSTDTLFITGGGIRPQALKRSGETSWSIEAMQFLDGPYLSVNISATNLTPAATGNPVPKMTGNSAPSGVVTSSNNSSAAWQLFGQSDGKVVLSAGATGWVAYEFPAGVVVDGYMLQAPNDNADSDNMPAQWVLEASANGTDWAILDVRDAESTWASSEWRRFSFANEAAYKHYRLKFTQGGGSNADQSAIGQLVMHQAAASQEPFNLVASSLDGINSGEGFGSEDVGRHIRLRGSDGVWRWVEVASVVSTTTAKVRLHGQALLDQSAMGLFRLGAWSDRTGWPSAVGWHKNRLALAGTDFEPTQTWESQSDDFRNFAVSQPLVASDAVSVGILSGQVNRIKWLVDDSDLLVGTTRAVRQIGKATEQDPYGPENVDQKPSTNFGANGIQPIKIGSVVLYFGRYGTDMRELVYDIGSNGRVSQSVSEVQSHLFRPGMAGACYQQYPSSIIWGWDVNGRSLGFTYEREQEVYGMQRHEFGGVVECMASLSGSGFDEVWTIVRREINGETRRYIEIMQAPFVDQDIADAWHLDCAVRYEGEEVNSVSGLEHLEGEAVILYADGSDYPTTVESGEVSLPNGRKASKILVGLDVTARAKTLSPPVNSQDGSSLGRKISVDVTHVSVFQTGTLRMGSDGTYLDEQIRYEAGDAYGAPAPLKTGRIEANIEVRWEDGGQIVFEASGGKPCTIRALNANVTMEP